MPLVVNGPEFVESLYKDNVGLAYFLAKKYSYVFERWDIEELESLALYGLYRAARCYMPDKGPFSRYATRSIKCTIFKAMKKSPIVFAQLFENVRHPRSSFLDQRRLDVVDQFSRVEGFVKTMRRPKNAWQVIEMRFIKGMTLAEVGKVFGVTRQRVEQQEKMVLKAIREQFADSK